jgi:hypothetical protein
MNLKLPVSDGDIEGLVRGYLETESRSVDVEANRRTIEARLRIRGGEMPDERTVSRQRLLLPSAGVRRFALAAGLFLAVATCLYLALSPESAGAYALVRDAEQALGEAKDRCYRVSSDVPQAWLRSNPFLSSGDETLVFTRGDRFRVVTKDHGREIAWGQDEKRNVWVVDNGLVGFNFEQGEAPQLLGRQRAYLSLNVRQLVKRFLDDFDLTFENGRAPEGQRVVRVHARRKPEKNSVPISSAWIEIDRKTKVIRRLELERAKPGLRPGGFTFTLVEQTALPDDAYRVEGNLSQGGEVFGTDRKPQRDQRFWELVQSRRKN